MFQATTRDISVAVEPIFLDNESSPEEGHYMWAYRVVIQNKGPETVQLISRHWRITDARGHVVDVRGEGVVRKQPVLKPGESFDYTSSTPLSTPYGLMGGEYQMTTASGEPFEVTIPTFSLLSPFAKRSLN